MAKAFFSKNHRVTSPWNVVMQSGNEVRFAPISRGIFVPGMIFPELHSCPWRDSLTPPFHRFDIQGD